MTGEAPRFGPGREFERIRGFVDGIAEDPRVRVGPGDDACVLADGLVISTDLCIEGIHFRPDWISYEEAGFRAAAAGASDLAAMAADPVGLLVSVAAPAGGERAAAIMAGVRELAEGWGLPLLGGDLTRSPGPVLVDVVSVGRTSEPLLRSGAEPGDELWVTGELGAAAGAVALWSAGHSVPEELRSAFTRPAPRIAEARWLREVGASAGLDLSDGLAGDAGHLAAASRVAVVLESATIPIAPALESESVGMEPLELDPWELALHGGDDFELLVSVRPGRMDARVDEFLERFHLSLTRVGHVTEGEGVSLADADGSRPLARGGYDHFAEGGKG